MKKLARSYTQIFIGMMLMGIGLWGAMGNLDLLLNTENPMDPIWLLVSGIGGVIVVFNITEPSGFNYQESVRRRRKKRFELEPDFHPPIPPSLPLETKTTSSLKHSDALKDLDTPHQDEEQEATQKGFKTGEGFNPEEKKAPEYEAELESTGNVECPGCGYFTDVRGHWETINCEGCGATIRVKR